MYIDIAFTDQYKHYKRLLLCTSYRDGKKVKHKTIANLSSCSEDEIAAIALKNKKNLSDLEPKHFIIKDRIAQGKSVGAVFFVLYETSKQLGIEKSLWSSR